MVKGEKYNWANKLKLKMGHCRLQFSLIQNPRVQKSTKTLWRECLTCLRLRLIFLNNNLKIGLIRFTVKTQRIAPASPSKERRLMSALVKPHSFPALLIPYAVLFLYTVRLFLSLLFPPLLLYSSVMERLRNSNDRQDVKISKIRVCCL